MPDEGINLTLVKIDCGELSKAATVLIERVSNGLGAWFLPTQIERIATAEGKAGLIKTQYQLHSEGLQRRAAQRVLAEESKRQHNIETIVQKALPSVKESANPSAIDEDWMENFLDKARIASKEEMQNLWSRILAGEANKPGTFAKRTINFLADVDKRDAEAFSVLCSFGFGADNDLPLIFEPKKHIYTKHGLDISTLLHLESIGLLKHRYDGSTFYLTYPRSCPRKEIQERYFERVINLDLTNQSNHLPIGTVLLTPLGKELAPVAGAQKIDGFFEYVAKFWHTACPARWKVTFATNMTLD